LVGEPKFVEFTVAGCTRNLRLHNLNEKTAIAGFIILGDVELTEACAAELAKRIPQEAELLMTAEAKSIPLVAAMARVMGMKRYIVARKSVKAYMDHPICVEDESITTKGKQMLCLMDDDVESIRGRKVCLVDDVISTGGSLKALNKLAALGKAEVIGQAAILAEGDAAKRDDIIFLAELPLFDAV